MSKRQISRVGAGVTLALGLALSLPGGAAAQTIGTFTWQTQPFCNVLGLQVIQQGALFQIVGTDNQCGSGPAAVTGTAVPVGGNVVMGLTVALPGGRAAHLSTSIGVGTLSGTWTDGDGNRGELVFNGAAAGAPRPFPASASSIVAAQLAPAIYGGAGTATTIARSDHDHALAGLQSRTVEANFAFANVTIQAGACVLRGIGDGASGALRSDGLAMATILSTVDNNLGLIVGSPKTLSNGFATVPLLFCNNGTLALVVNQTINVRIRVFR